MVKLLFCGDAFGNLDEILLRVNKLNASAHGPFDVLFCTGQLLSLDDTAPDALGN